MFYKFDKNELKFVKVKWISTGLKIFTGILIVSMFLGWTFKPVNKESYTEEEVMIFTAKQNMFSSEKLIDVIKGYNFKFPHVVYAQSILESGNFKSPVFKENHNLFGMKEATKRINRALGTQNGHAIYKDWLSSVDDYALYCATYLHEIVTEEDYIGYLSQKYAEDNQYKNKLMDIIKKENLKEIFK